jgi:histone-lysine N-methyltransferase SUV420H
MVIFQRHLRKYIEIYFISCLFEILSTNRYTLTTHEATVVAQQAIKNSKIILYLCSIRVRLTGEELAELASRHFSIVFQTRNKATSLLLSLARFLNYDCAANAELFPSRRAGIGVRACWDIEIGSKITVLYGNYYFGDFNCECLCKTCEERKQNGWRQGSRNSTEVLPTPSTAVFSHYPFRHKLNLNKHCRIS